MPVFVNFRYMDTVNAKWKTMNMKRGGLLVYVVMIVVGILGLFSILINPARLLLCRPVSQKKNRSRPSAWR